MEERQTQYQDNSAEAGGMVRFGFVTATDGEKRLARVHFPDLNMESDWLPVLINRDFIPGHDGTQRTEKRAGGSGYAAFESHDHELTIKPYMPRVNEQVVCLYEPVRNGRGVVLGGVAPWQ